ncbi:hypothetical protein cypCar_00020495 [Cyprinus carpio]|nr:hypothetical protein cypCar_00020495 [Cyprinus carpio]
MAQKLRLILLNPPALRMMSCQRRAYLTGALVLGMLYFLCCLVLFLGVKEQLAPLSKLDRINVPYLTAIKMIVGHTPYVRLVFGFLFASLAFQTAATISIPVWQTVLVTIGKKNTIFIGLSVNTAPCY